MYMLIVLNLEFMLIVFILELYICMFFSEINLQLFFFFFSFVDSKAKFIERQYRTPKKGGVPRGLL